MAAFHGPADALPAFRTFFQNGRPVDDRTAAVVADGDTLALSGAMPGLIGATMRRGGFLTPFCSGISHGANDPGIGSGKGRSILKPLNWLIEELGSRFLAQGIWVPRPRLADIFPLLPDLAATRRAKSASPLSAPSPTP